MTNKYLTKIASDLATAEKNEKDENDDVKKYSEELKKARNPKLVAALKFALPEEKQHRAKFEAAVAAIKQRDH
jgi:rubrerythrin